MRCVLTAAFVAAIAGAACAEFQPDGGVVRPAGSSRVVRTFSFDERDANPGDVPLDWYRGQDDPQSGNRRPGFPSWNQGSLIYKQDGASPFAGDGLVRLPTQGGSTSLVLAPGMLPIFPGTDYRVRAQVRTLSLRHSRAAVVATLQDRTGKPIPGGRFVSAPTLSEGVWQEVTVDVRGRSSAAAWLQLELVLLQPEQLGTGRAADRFTIRTQDYAGSAMFDEVEVSQLPRLELRAASNGVFGLGEPVSLGLSIRDLSGEPLSAQIRVLDSDGREVSSENRPIAGGRADIDWMPRVQRAGWYRAEVQLRTTNDGREICTTTHDFAMLARTGRDRWQDTDRFALIVRGEDPAELLRLSSVLSLASGAGEVTLDAWTPDDDAERAEARADALEKVVASLRASGQTVALSLPTLPRSLAQDAALGATDIYKGLSTTGIDARPYILPLRERFAGTVSRWVLGVPGDDAVFETGDWQTRAPRVRSVVFGVGDSELLVTTTTDARWDMDALSTAGVGLVVDLGGGTPPDTIHAAVQDWCARVRGRTEVPECTFVFSPSNEFSARERAARLSMGVVQAWSAMCGDGTNDLPPRVRLALRDPWNGSEATRASPVMLPEFTAWRSTLDRIADRRVVGTLPVPGMTCLILSPSQDVSQSRGGALVAWSNGEAGSGQIRTFLGTGDVQVVDMFGNSTPAERTADGESIIPVGDSIVFAEGVDVPALRLLATVQIDDPKLPATMAVHERHVVLTNPFRTGVSGTIMFLEPGGNIENEGERADRSWRLTPRELSFTAGPGETIRIPFSVAFNPGAETTDRDFVMRLKIGSDATYPPFDVRRRVEIGLPGLRMHVDAFVQGTDLIVDSQVRNEGSTPRDLDLTAFVPGAPRSKSQMRELPATRSATRRFVFPGVGESLRGQRIMVSLSEPESGARLNRSAEVR